MHFRWDCSAKRLKQSAADRISLMRVL